jgi:hypothetical protein
MICVLAVLIIFTPMATCQLKTADQLSPAEIMTILRLWDIPEWLDMPVPDFRSTFSSSSFYLLTTDDTEDILCVARINHDFKLRIGDETHRFAELVGLVSAGKQKGAGSLLLQSVISEAIKQDMQLIGFCKTELRQFYQKNHVELLYGKARSVYEKENGQWTPSTDDDILILNLSPSNRQLLENLAEDHPAQLVTDDPA